MQSQAQAGYHVIASDQRGYGQTTGWDGGYDGEVGSFRQLNRVQDALALVNVMGWRSVSAVLGHDFGCQWRPGVRWYDLMSSSRWR